MLIRDRFHKLITFLGVLHSKQFSMVSYISVRRGIDANYALANMAPVHFTDKIEIPDIKACPIGWCPIIFPDYWTFIDFRPVIIGSKFTRQSTREFFGLEEHERTILFGGNTKRTVQEELSLIKDFMIINKKRLDNESSTIT